MNQSFGTSDFQKVLGGVKATKSVICSALAFLEAIEEDIGNPGGPSPLQVIEQREVKANGIVAQGRRVAFHLTRFGVATDHVSGDKSGRKTPQARQIAARIVEYLRTNGFESSAPAAKVQLLHDLSAPFRSKLGSSLGPIRITPAGMMAAAAVEQILEHAEDRGIVSAIAELLVGSKLEVCIGGNRAAGIAAQHKWENGHDDPNALGDYRIENVAFEVTMVKGPDETHRIKANRITAGGTEQCWLIVRSDKIKAWQDFIAKAPSKHPRLVRCFGICEFIGQNLAETEWRSSKRDTDPLRDVVAKLNELVARLGPQFLPGARVELVG
jgi:hypothetical protein